MMRLFVRLLPTTLKDRLLIFLIVECCRSGSIETADYFMQIHDAVLIQYPQNKEDEIIPRIQSQLRVPIALEGGRELVIPYGVSTGWNWGKHSENNPDGLKAYKGGDKRKRQPQVSILDRPVRRVYR